MLIRVLVAAALGTALLTCITVSVPEDLPAIAAGQPGLYRLEVALLVFYGWLLLATPVVSGLARGQLPIEVSTRGARFAEGADHSAGQNERKIEDLKQTADDLAGDLLKVRLEIERLKEAARRDSTPPAIRSER